MSEFSHDHDSMFSTTELQLVKATKRSILRSDCLTKYDESFERKSLESSFKIGRLRDKYKFELDKRRLALLEILSEPKTL